MSKKIFFIVLLSSSFYLLTSVFIWPYYLFLTKTLKISLLKTLLSLDSLKTYNDQVTILILGIAGSQHDGGTLSDSMIVANYNLKNHRLLTISLPRDIWSDTLQDKINTAYAYGEAKQKNGGLKLAKAEVGAVIGIPIQYALVIDFAKFKALIDLLGGIEIDVDRSFTDKQFPIPDRENAECDGDPDFKCRYETVSFKKGITHMDGATVLKYVRSRHAVGVEGSDFARNKRQQKVLEAIKNKVFANIKKYNLNDLKKLYQVLDKLLTRDISNQQVAIVVKNIIFLRDFAQKEISLSQDFFLVPDNNLYNGQYVLMPREGNFANLHLYIQCYRKNLDSRVSSFNTCETLKRGYTYQK
ncbi:LCP family protein [Candidatus Roizmanbacteria bacterium]|nr:LCP family protein [Candidatus Roizmanbacteria bacterium]